jgi:hypothetical protein
MQLIAEPYVPYALWLALALIAVAALAWYGWRGMRSTPPSRRWLILGLMSVTLALPLIVLLNLTWIQNVPPPAGKPVVRILIDSSASMATVDVDNESRWDRAAEIASETSEALSDQFDVRLAVFAEQRTVTDLANLKLQSPAAGETNLSNAIADSIKENVPQGQSMLLISDGIHNMGSAGDVISVAQKAQAMNVPIFTATLGGPVGVKNLAVSLRSPQELAFVGQTVPVVAQLDSQGFGNRPHQIELWNDGEMVESAEVNVPQPSNAASDQITEATFNLQQNKTGLYRYEIRVTDLPDEATAADNRATLLFRVVDRPIKMLLVEGKPYWDTKFLVRRLAADQSVELTSVIRMTENRYLKRTVTRIESDLAEKTTDEATADETSGDDTSNGQATENTQVINDADSVLSAESLTDVQIVVLGRNAEFFLGSDSLDALRNWIARDGGSLVCSRGAPSSQVSERLGQILPVRWTAGRESRFRVSLTDQGRDLRWLANFGDGDVLGAMPSLATVATASQRVGLSNVLAATVQSGGSDSAGSAGSGDSVVPVLSWQPYGSGRTVVIEGAGMWRWALMAPEHAEQEEVYATLWRSLLRWLVSRSGLMPGQNVSLQPDRVSFDSGDVATATMLVRQGEFDTIPQVLVRREENASEKTETESATDSETETNIRRFSAVPVGQDPGVYRLNFGKLPPGHYLAEVEYAGNTNNDSSNAVKTAFDVRQRWVEQLALDARPDLMNRIAIESGGAVLEDANVAEFAKQFEEHLTRSRPPQTRRVPMWDRWWVLVAIFSLWATTWVVRRRSGLV